MRSAEKVGEELYSFKPTPDVRSFAGVLGHIADANVMLCRVGAGETTIADVMKNIAAIQVHEKKSGKAELIAALKDARALCEKHFATVTDASGREPVAWFGGMQMPKLQVLQQATSHASEGCSSGSSNRSKRA